MSDFLLWSSRSSFVLYVYVEKALEAGDLRKEIYRLGNFIGIVFWYHEPGFLPGLLLLSFGWSGLSQRFLTLDPLAICLWIWTLAYLQLPGCQMGYILIDLRRSI